MLLKAPSHLGVTKYKTFFGPPAVIVFPYCFRVFDIGVGVKKHLRVVKKNVFACSRSEVYWSLYTLSTNVLPSTAIFHKGVPLLTFFFTSCVTSLNLIISGTLFTQLVSYDINLDFPFSGC